MQSIAYCAGLLLIAIGALVNVGIFVAYARELSVFFFVVTGWILTPWLTLFATLRLRPLTAVATRIVASVAGLLLAVTAAFFYDTRTSIHDAQGGVLFLIVPSIALAVTMTIHFLALSASRSSRNRLANSGVDVAGGDRGP